MAKIKLSTSQLSFSCFFGQQRKALETTTKLICLPLLFLTSKRYIIPPKALKSKAKTLILACFFLAFSLLFLQKKPLPPQAQFQDLLQAQMTSA
ncbi:MAG TPA: hypothetical protein H9850_09975 [Candidatus Anaerobiospirillum pullistercoris]|uniref:Uncharacterized protein n=1 Tax=Candidatus Anaerobiospirillum pullistercoris TaxID=2838452 RepID=A0A9D1WEP2_9GAMM|nr:hypothetical protein [Candidatus Anaerobiospirillum pullistercoris]